MQQRQLSASGKRIHFAGADCTPNSDPTHRVVTVGGKTLDLLLVMNTRTTVHWVELPSVFLKKFVLQLGDAIRSY